MGWCFYGASSPRTADEERAEILRLLTWDSSASASHVVEARKVGATWYAAIRVTPKPGAAPVTDYQPSLGGSYTFAAVVLTKRERGEWGYKAMDETMGPNARDCPRAGP